jgi:glutamate mutase epsilon subunit
MNFSNVNSNLAVGQSVTASILLTQGSTAYYLNAYQVDGSTVTPKWSGGSAPTAGNASGIDSYSFTIIKTADATFTVLASQTQFA